MKLQALSCGCWNTKCAITILGYKCFIYLLFFKLKKTKNKNKNIITQHPIERDRRPNPMSSCAPPASHPVDDNYTRPARFPGKISLPFPTIASPPHEIHFRITNVDNHLAPCPTRSHSHANASVKNKFFFPSSSLIFQRLERFCAHSTVMPTHTTSSPTQLTVLVSPPNPFPRLTSCSLPIQCYHKEERSIF